MLIQQPKFPKPNRRALTLIELLVVVSIIAILTAMMIPRLRIINKDRNIRETARVVGSGFANASQRAQSDGAAGLLLVRNPNLVDDAGVNFACTTFYQMRALPPYIGDYEASRARISNTSGNTVVTIDTPLEHDSSNEKKYVVRKNDTISFNNNSMQYRIATVAIMGSNMTITLATSNYLPTPADTILPGVPFVIHRQPQKMESSRQDLPEGYLIDLRASGPLQTVAPFGSVFNVAAGANEIKLIYDRQGKIDYLDNGGPGNIMSDSFYLFISGYEPESTDISLDNADNLWVTINSTGGVNIGYTTLPDVAAVTLNERIISARTIATEGQSAAQ